MKRTILKNLTVCLVIFSLNGQGMYVQAQNYLIEEMYDISYVPAAFPVGFSLLTQEPYQYVAFYDSAKYMTVASRRLESETWNYKRLDNQVGWDSHNSVTLAIDPEGYLHVSGNMHAVPLIYYRSSKPYDIQSLERIDRMVGTEENRVTYPVFMKGPNGELLYHYRHGGSGNGYEVYNIWIPQEKKWKRYLDKPLIDGKGERNAYMVGPVLGPDRIYHLIWVWRETPDCATNHTLSYARSKDLLHWEDINGKRVPLSITIEEKSLYVDTTPPGGGLFNPGIRLGFDPSGNVIVGYHKYDRNQHTQLYIARYEDGRWNSRQITQWDFKWIFKGNGSIPTELTINTPKALPDGRIAFGYQRSGNKSGEILLDATTLLPVGERAIAPNYPVSLDDIISDFPGMSVRKAFDAGHSADGKYVLRWETLPANRDARREGSLPPPSMLRLYKYKEQ